MRIGIVTTWFERGQSHLSRILRLALEQKHETFIFARTGGVYGVACPPETTIYWDVPNVYQHPTYEIDARVLQGWVINNRLDAVIFNEEHDWRLIYACKAAHAAAVCYLDWFDEGQRAMLRHYSAVLCSSHRSYDEVKDDCAAHYIGWGTDTDVYQPCLPGPVQFDFIHNAGWLGIRNRKCTPSVIRAFERLHRDIPDASLCIHAQVPPGSMPKRLRELIRMHPAIHWVTATTPAPGTYHYGRIGVHASKLEGLGLPLYEYLACGIPVITTDAPPMNEPITPDVGWLVAPHRVMQRPDGISFPETVPSVHGLEAAMRAALDADVEAMGARAREVALERHSIDALATRLLPAFEGLQRPRGPVVSTTPDPLDIGKGQPHVHLVSARHSNHPFGAGNEAFRALEAMGCAITDTDFRVDLPYIDELMRREADLTLVLKGDGIPAGVIERCPSRVVCWYPDDLKETPHARAQMLATGHAYDMIYTFSRADIPAYEELGLTAKWLPLACDPTLHRNLAEPKVIDVLHIGKVYPNRHKLLTQLGEKFRVRAVDGVFGEDYVRHINSAKIVINLGIGNGGIQHRVFEVLACGTMLISNRNDEVCELFEDQTHFAGFDSFDECAHLCAHYLEHEEERETIAAAGMAECLDKHTTEHRIRAMLEG